MREFFSRSAARKKAALISALVFAAVLLLAEATQTSGCASVVLPTADSTHVAMASKRWPGTTAVELDRGRKAYIERCAGCHSLYAPGAYSEQEWEKVLPPMERRAKASEQERALIEKYLLIHAKR